MHTQSAVSFSAPAVATLDHDRLSAMPCEPGHVGLGSVGERAARRLGRMLAGLPVSIWLGADLTVLTTGIWLGYSMYPPAELLTTPHVILWQALAVFAFAVAVASLVFGLYERETLVSHSRILTRMLLTTTTAVVVAYAVIYVLMYATLSRRLAGVATLLFLVGGTGIRLGTCWAIQQVRRGVVVVGNRALFESLRQIRGSGFLHEYRLLGYLTTGKEPAGTELDPYCLGPVDDHIADLEGRGVSDIVVGAEAASDSRIMQWMVAGLRRGCRVTNEATFYEKATGQILVDEITPAWFLFADLRVHCEKQATLKRCVDLTTAVIGLCLSAPLWPLIALAVKLGDGEPVFHVQDRVGRHGHIFRLYKFRTMHPNAENGKSVWSSPNDTRVTPIGRFLRRTRLDELPQLYNVLIGQMSIVGPRPERPDIVRELCRKVPYYAERHLVKPGLTGWAQISFRYGSSIEDATRKLQFDLYYLKHMSFELDMMIQFRTAGTFLKGAC